VNGAETLWYPFPEAPVGVQSVAIAPGSLWLRVPVPYVFLHINVWALEDLDGWTIIDTGAYTPEAEERWRGLLAGPLAGRPITRIIATHLHTDHTGMVGWLLRDRPAELWMTRLEYLTARVLQSESVGGAALACSTISFYRMAGWGESSMKQYRDRFGHFGRRTYALPTHLRCIRDGEMIRIGSDEWRVVVGAGHSPEHASLYCPARGLLISGDQVLPQSTANLAVKPMEPDADPLQDWLEGLTKVGVEVPDDVLVLPAHDLPFRGLHHRLQSLRARHLRCLERLRAALRTPKRVVDLFDVTFRIPIGESTLNMATGETIAHLNYLRHRREVTVFNDADGINWYEANTPGSEQQRHPQ
jgi:glyoxylase-like metal-dependent hydrolase (beta-lactamase superfamily II)